MAKKIVLGGLIGLVLACVSKTVPEERYVQSLSLSAPLTEIFLPDPENFTFAIVGDIHVKNQDTTRFQRILKAAAEEGDAFLIALGDNVDHGAREDFLAFKQAIEESGFKGRVLPVIGNHDIFGDGWMHYQELIGPSHYAVTVGNSKFITFDTADGTVSASERAWLETELQKDRPGHLFFLTHYLPIIPGQRTYLKIANDEEARDLMKLASDARVTAWLGAHYHSFVVGRVENVDYVVAGGGGNRRMAPVFDYFFVQVKVAGSEVSYRLRVVP